MFTIFTLAMAAPSMAGQALTDGLHSTTCMSHPARPIPSHLTPITTKSTCTNHSTSWAANLPLINNSCINIGTTGPNNSPEETIAVGASILSVAAATNIDPRFILAIMMQESKGCVRVQTTYGGNANPGLMQSHAGPNTCAGISPCPVEIITGMLSDGAGGTPSGDGLAAIMDELTSANATNQLSFGNDTTSEQMYYRTARIYNSGSIASTGNLGGGLGSTNCYVSDVANRLLGWVFAGSSCTAENAGAAAYTAPEAVWNGSTTNWNGTITNGNGTTTTTAATDGCVLVQTGDTCSSIAEELGVSTEVFLQANTGIDADCTNLLAGFSYCA